VKKAMTVSLISSARERGKRNYAYISGERLKKRPAHFFISSEKLVPGQKKGSVFLVVSSPK
jgi:hypothetical protein